MTAGLCVCGGSRTQHTLDEEGCWCERCLSGPATRRCLLFEQAATPPPRMRPSQRRETSAIAGKVARLRQGTRRKDLFDLIRTRGYEGATDDELEDLTGKAHQSISATRNSLVADGLVVDSGKQRHTKHGFPAIVWVTVGLPPKPNS